MPTGLNQSPQAFQPISGTPEGPRILCDPGIDDPRTDTSHQTAKNGRGMWPQYGASHETAQLSLRAKILALWHRRKPDFGARKGAPSEPVIFGACVLTRALP